jgi:hypothetical protein
MQALDDLIVSHIFRWTREAFDPIIRACLSPAMNFLKQR